MRLARAVGAGDIVLGSEAGFVSEGVLFDLVGARGVRWSLCVASSCFVGR